MTAPDAVSMPLKVLAQRGPSIHDDRLRGGVFCGQSFALLIGFFADATEAQAVARHKAFHEVKRPVLGFIEDTRRSLRE